MLALATNTACHHNTCTEVYNAIYIHKINTFFYHLDHFSLLMYSSDKNPSDSLEAEEEQHQHVRKMMFMAAFTVANTVATTALIYANPLYNKVPYHTSALSGADWVWELLSGHPDCICNELGVCHHVFWKSCSWQGMGLPSTSTLKNSSPFFSTPVSLVSLFSMFVNASNIWVIQYQSRFLISI